MGLIFMSFVQAVFVRFSYWSVWNFMFVFVYREVTVYLLKVQMAAVSVVPAILDFLSDEVRLLYICIIRWHNMGKLEVYMYHQVAKYGETRSLGALACRPCDDPCNDDWNACRT